MPVTFSASQRRWPASLAVAVAILLQLILPEQVSLGPWWLLPAVQAGLLVPLVAANPIHLRTDHPVLRIVAVALAACVMGFNAALLFRLVVALSGGIRLTSQELLLTVAAVLTTNVVAAAVGFWELDRGGPFARDPRHARPTTAPDLLFPQDSFSPGAGSPWRPSFTDYLFVAFTLTTAFSPTDTMPLTARAKMLFMAGAAVSMTSFAVIVARAANLL